MKAVGGAICTATDVVASVLITVVHFVVEFVTDLVETLGHLIADGLDALSRLASGVPVLGPLLHWLANVFSGLFDLAGAVVKTVDAAGAVAGGLLRMVFGGIGGLIAWDGRVFMKGLADVFCSIFGVVLVVGGKAVAAIQFVLWMQFKHRPLSDEEKQILARVYQGSVARYNVRIVDGFAGLFSLNDRPFTLGNTIYWKDFGTDHPTLVHECAHVWQYQHDGVRYTFEALWAQLTVKPDAYKWEDELDVRGKTHWRVFNREAQAATVEAIFHEGKRNPTTNTEGELYDADPLDPTTVSFAPGGTDRTAFAVETVKHVRGDFLPRLSRVAG